MKIQSWIAANKFFACNAKNTIAMRNLVSDAFAFHGRQRIARTAKALQITDVDTRNTALATIMVSDVYFAESSEVH